MSGSDGADSRTSLASLGEDLAAYLGLHQGPSIDQSNPRISTTPPASSASDALDARAVDTRDRGTGDPRDPRTTDREDRNVFNGRGSMFGLNGLNGLATLLNLLNYAYQPQPSLQPYISPPPITIQPPPPPNTPNQPLPSVALSASPSSIPVNGTATLTWFSLRATRCTLSSAGGVFANHDTAGSASTTSLTTTTTFTLSCEGAGGTRSASATVYVGEPAPATSTLPEPAPALTVSSGTGATSGTQGSASDPKYCDPGDNIDLFIVCLQGLPVSSNPVQ
jgi:hypothetical protein